MLEFGVKKVLVIGDIMIDRYLGGGISGTSPEAEVPIFSKISESNHPGGAANVAVNLKELGTDVTLIGIVGDDIDGKLLTKLIARLDQIDGHIIVDPDRKTTVKTRIISEGRHILRVDTEDTHEVSRHVFEDFSLKFQQIMKKSTFEAIIIQDYNKGLLSPDVIMLILSEAKKSGIPVFVDPKFNNFFEYQGATLIKPNKKELEIAIGKKVTISELINEDHLELLRNRLECDTLLVTLSAAGIIYVNKDEKKHVKAFPRNVADVCGAGDTVIATITLAFISGYNMQSIALLANIAGGQVCEQSGVVAVRKDLLQKEYMDRHNPQ